jgi:alanine dehydrogenase
MNIGLLKEDPVRERRIALTPAGVQTLVSAGNQVYVEKNAGIGAHFSNEEYESVGAKIVYTSDEVFGRSQMVLKISPPRVEDCELLNDSQILFSFLHLPIAKPKTIELLREKKICAIGYELIEDSNGEMPILQVMSEIAGQMTITIASRYLESSVNGRGIVMGGITGIPPATVLILGAGTVGQTAARIAFDIGAEVIVLDKDLSRMRTLACRFEHRIATAVANEYNIKNALLRADVVIGAVLIKAERAPHILTEEMVKIMKPGSILIDVSIDQGGCSATSRPTTIENPTYVYNDVIHYCVPNMTANIARTATYGLTNTLLPYLTQITEHGIESILANRTGLEKGVCMFKGSCVNDSIARRFGIDYVDIHSLVN